MQNRIKIPQKQFMACLMLIRLQYCFRTDMEKQHSNNIIEAIGLSHLITDESIIRFLKKKPRMKI